MTQGDVAYNIGRFVLGIDAGGTSLRLVIAERDSEKRIAEIEGAAAPDGGPEALLPLIDALSPAVREAQAIGAVCAGITKFTREGVRQRWEQTLAERFPAATCLVVPDYTIAFHGALLEGIGLAVIAGTGSVVYGEDGQGGTVRVGGRGWEYGDEGSGAFLTTEMIRQTLRALDGMVEMSPLVEAVCKRFGTRDPVRLAEMARQEAASEGRGFLVPFVLESAQAGDGEAANLFVGAAGWLAAWGRCAYRQLHFSPDAPVPVATIGGMWTAGELIITPFTQVVRRWIPAAILHPPAGAPVEGAVRMALRLNRN